MQAAAVFAAEQDLRHQSIFERVGRTPLAGYHGVEAEMPPSVVAKLLRPTIDFPAPERLEALVVHDEHATRRLAVLVAERRHIDAAGPAMHGVRPGVAGFVGELLRLDDLNNLRFARIGFGVENIDAGRAQPRNDQITALDMRMRSVGT